MTKSNLTVNQPYRVSRFWPLVSVLVSALVLIAITFAPISALLNLFHDDSFFYMVIARNHTAGFGYSFDGLNKTNGFHLLWLWSLSFMGSTIALTGDQGIRAVVALQTVLSLSAALLYVRLLNQFNVKSWIQILFFLAYLFLCTLADIGQESAPYGFLVALLVSMLLGANESQDAPIQWLRMLILMLLAMLTVLVRLDCIFLLGGIALALFLAQRKVEAFTLLIGMAIGLTATFSFNYLLFGHGYSISSWLKSGFDLSKAMQLFIPGLLMRVGLVCLLLGSALWQYKRAQAFTSLRLAPAKMPFTMLLTLCVGLAYGAYFAVLFLEVSALGSWYFNQALGLCAFLFALTFSADAVGPQSSNAPPEQQLQSTHLSASPKGVWHILTYTPLFIAIGMGAILFNSKFFWAHSSAATKEMGEWIYRNTEPNTVIFQRDGAGAVSYFAKRHLINGDGLVNNMQYQVLLRTGKLCEYLKDQQVQYVVTNTAVNAADRVQDYIFLWTTGVASVPLTNVVPSAALYATEASPKYRLFRIQDAGTGCLQ